MNKNTCPVITLPYRGHIETMATYHAVEGRYQFDYQDPSVKTIQDYNEKMNKCAILATWAELSEIHNTWKETLKEPAELITKERFWEMLEVLPPCKWHNIGGVEVFHISERLTDNLVSWFAHSGDKYAEATDQDCLNDEELRALFGGVL